METHIKNYWKVAFVFLGIATMLLLAAFYLTGNKDEEIPSNGVFVFNTEPAERGVYFV